MLARFETDGPVKQLLLHVLRMGDEWQTHPRAYRLIVPANLAGVDPGSESENERSGDGQD